MTAPAGYHTDDRAAVIHLAPGRPADRADPRPLSEGPTSGIISATWGELAMALCPRPGDASYDRIGKQFDEVEDDPAHPERSTEPIDPAPDWPKPPAAPGGC